MIFEDALNIYTDGSSYSGPRKGGIGIRFITFNNEGYEQIQDSKPSGFKGATNNQMELYACTYALKEAPKLFNLNSFNKVVINTDSLYIVNNHNNALFNWPRNRWRNREGRPIENTTFWKDLVKAIKKINKKVEFYWVEGHSKDIHNRAVDKLAKQSAKNALNDPLAIESVRRKTSEKSLERGSVKMHGQRLLIRIISNAYFKTQRIYKYRYEVLSKASKYYGNVDIIFSEELLRDGHCFCVSLNKNTANPTIMRVIKEVDCKTGDQIE